MKTRKVIIGVCALALLFASCKDEKAELAKQIVNDYTTYVDSITALEYKEAYSNWKSIEDEYNSQKSMANEEINDAKEKATLQIDVDNATLKYETFKANLIADNEKIEISKSKLRKVLLGPSYIDSGDMTFVWINKNNILSVYKTFVDTVEANKDSYSREDWDEIKLLYEAIDTRKNTVENEGLTSSDNRQIALLKLKFAPMYTVNRMGAKSEENSEAKE